MAKAMKAAVVRELGQPLTIEEVPIPQPRAGEILVKIHACGVCGTDLHAARGDWPVKPKLHAGQIEGRLVLDFDAGQIDGSVVIDFGD